MAIQPQLKSIYEEVLYNNKMIIAITGHIGTGKTYLTKTLVDIFNSGGFDVGVFSFATPIKRAVYYLFGGDKILHNGKDIEVPPWFLVGVREKRDEDVLRTILDALDRYLDFSLEPKPIEVVSHKENFPKVWNAYKNLKASIREENGTYYLPLRKIYQYLGDMARGIDRDIFAKRLVYKVKDFLHYAELLATNPHSALSRKSTSKVAIISDLRFLNEEETLRKNFLPNHLLIVRKTRSTYGIIKDLGITEEEYKKWLSHISEREVDQIKADIEVGLV